MAFKMTFKVYFGY